VFQNLLQAAGKKESMHVELRLIATGMISSTLFWCGVLFILVTGESHLIIPLQYLICTTSLFLAGGLSYDFFPALRRRLYRLTATICDSLLEVVDFSTGRRGGNCDGWRPGDAINTGFALRAMSRLLSSARRDRSGARFAARLD
jgi:hypothetical protein